jgi:flagellin
MAQTINTNIVSLNAQRNLNQSQSSLATSMQRLSSGLRVNSAKDDAAGLAIAERMNTQVRGLNVAARNANDGISLAQTAEGALGKVGDMLQRMRELAVQSANATNSIDDRKALDAEVQQLKAEINRVASTTSFNGQKILDGSFTNASFQIGANSGETITFSSVANAQTNALGVSTRASLNSVAITSLSTAALTSAENMTVNGTAIGAMGAATTVSDRANQLVTAINTVAATTGVTAFIDTVSNSIQLNSAANITLAEGTVTTGFFGTLTATAAATTGISSVDVLSSGTAAQALSTIDTALDAVNSSRGTLGALQSRFENAISNIQVTAENLSAARGRIMDADFAAETANMSRAQILQSAGTAMVAQANQLPQQVLQLLQR